tara:strand:+ start:433 stop:537 length:105 start_codon:yes stop_codon:yes gene_type:complete
VEEGGEVHPARWVEALGLVARGLVPMVRVAAGPV